MLRHPRPAFPRSASITDSCGSWWHRPATQIVGAGLLGAFVLEALALVLADPAELRWAASVKGWSLPAIHVAAFLVFWALASAASLLGYLGWLAVGAWKVRTRLR